MNNINHIITLLKQHIGEDIDSIDNPELQRLIQQYPVISEVMKEVNDEESLRRSLSSYMLYSQNELDRIENKIIVNIRTEEQPISLSTSRKVWKISLSAAAACILIFFAGYWFWGKSLPSSDKEYIETFHPGSNRATLTLSDGKTIALAEGKSGLKVNENIAYADGTMVLPIGHDHIHNTVMQLTTPRGGQYIIELSDGTKVWLNAESNLQYPAQFSGNIREVKLIGEAYFEVAPNKQKPFIVSTEKEKVEVLGTHFNVSSYKDGDYSAVTLSEGKVKVAPLANPTNASTLTPNRQAIIRGSEIEELSVNAEEYIAWKNGEFMFNNESLANVLKQLSRWYDFDYSIAPELKDLKIWGSISKYENFDKVLKIIKITDKKIKLNIEGRKVLIMEEK